VRPYDLDFIVLFSRDRPLYIVEIKFVQLPTDRRLTLATWPGKIHCWCSKWSSGFFKPYFTILYVYLGVMQICLHVGCIFILEIVRLSCLCREKFIYIYFTSMTKELKIYYLFNKWSKMSVLVIHTDFPSIPIIRHFCPFRYVFVSIHTYIYIHTLCLDIYSKSNVS